MLTGGRRPSAAVLGSAADNDIPIMLCSADTRTVLERAENVIHRGRTRDERTVDVMGDLLVDHADIDALLGAGD